MPAATPRATERLPQASLLPLHSLLDDVALIEACDGTTPLPATGHRVSDAGAALVLAVSMAHDRLAATIARRCLTFLDAMHLGDGRFRPNDADPDDHPGDHESCGWAIEGIGTATNAPWPDISHDARRLFAATTRFETDDPRARAHALLGAVAAAGAPDPVPGARTMTARILEQLTGAIDRQRTAAWPWPEARLHPGSGAIAEALVAGADAIGDADDLAAALASLRWFADIETAPGHLSSSPSGGRGPENLGTGFDQRPLAAAALAAAAGRALRLTGDRSWERPVVLAARWFAGANDVGVTMFDRDTGRAYDALRHDGADGCQGAEAAVAFATVLRELQRLRYVPPRPASSPE